MQTPVTFPIAKLLKEKGFNENCSDYYTSTRGLNSNGWGDIIYKQGFGSGSPDRMLKFNYSDFNKYQKETYFLCPTIAEVVMWLYEKHGIWVSVYEYKDHAADVNDKFVFRTSYTKLKEFNSPTEAYEAVIEYVLKDLV